MLTDRQERSQTDTTENNINLSAQEENIPQNYLINQTTLKIHAQISNCNSCSAYTIFRGFAMSQLFSNTRSLAYTRYSCLAAKTSGIYKEQTTLTDYV